MSQENSQSAIIEQAYEDYAGIFVRGLSRSVATDRLVRVMPNPTLGAIIGRSNTQVSRLKNGHADLKMADAEKLYKFYLEVSQMPVAGPDPSVYDDSQTVPYYTRRDVQAVLTDLSQIFDQYEGLIKGLRRRSMTSLRGIRDAAPETLPEISFDDAGHLLRDGVTIDGKEPTVIKEATEADTEKPAELKERQVYERTNDKGVAYLSTDKRQWFAKPINPDYQIIETDGMAKSEPDRRLFNALTMWQRVFLETMTLAQNSQVDDEDTEARDTMNKRPAAFWKIYWKYAADDNQKLRDLPGRFMARDHDGHKYFDDLEAIQAYEQKLMRYYRDHKAEFAEEGHEFDHSAEAIGLD